MFKISLSKNKIFKMSKMSRDMFTLLRFTQTAVASFGPNRTSECGQKPGGFTRLSPKVLNWVKGVTGMEYHPDISDPGELFSLNCSKITSYSQPC